MRLITGKLGEPHVSSLQHRNIIGSITGEGSYISALYNRLEPSISGNVLSISSGVLIHHGCAMQVDYGSTDTVQLTAGTAGYYRKDRVVARWTQNSSTGIESVEWVVIQGVPAATEAQAVLPSYNTGNMQEGALIDDCPVFTVAFSGVTPTVTKVPTTMPNIGSIEQIRSWLNGALSVQSIAVLEGDTVINRGDNTLSFGVQLPSGYACVGIVGVQTSGSGSSNLRLRGFGITRSGSGYVKVVNEQTSTAELTPSITAYVLVAKTAIF